MIKLVVSQVTHSFKNKTAVIGIIGLGYVGLPLAQRFVEMGFSVIGIDNDQKRVDELVKTKDSSDWGKKFVISGDYSYVNEMDAIIICVPTPLNKYREPDLSHITDSLESILPFLKVGQIISLESTTYPGTTEEIIVPRIKRVGFRIGQDIHLVYSPERIDPGRTDFTTSTIPRILGGVTTNCLEAGIQLYSTIIDKVIPVSSVKTAEMTKLVENIQRAVNIGLMNELKIVCEKMGIDIHEVIDAAATKPFGFTPFRPGPGLGGHCIPVDPFYLTWKAREYGVHSRLVELAGEINSSMPFHVMGKVKSAMNDRKKPVNGSAFLLLGLSYKKNVDDLRESPAIFFLEKLLEDGALVSYSDPHIPSYVTKDGNIHLESVHLSLETISTYDCVILITDHDKFDFDLIEKSAQLIVDTRGKYRTNSAHIVRA